EAFAPDDRIELSTLLDGVCASAVPAGAGIAGETRDGRRLDLELLVLPLRHRGRTHARLLGSLSSENWPYWAGQVPLVWLRLLSVRHLTAGGPAEPDLISPSPLRALGRLRLLTGGRA